MHDNPTSSIIRITNATLLLSFFEQCVCVSGTYLVPMNLLVLFQVRARAKLLVAEGAGEGLLPRVYPLVTYQVGDLKGAQMV